MAFKYVVIAFYFLLVSSSAFAGDDTKIQFLPPNNTNHTSIYNAVKSSEEIASLLSFINEYFFFPKPLIISFGSIDGPLFDSELNRIQIPYAFLSEVQQRFINANYIDTGVSPELATNDALMHALFHELAHALIHNHRLIVLGKEEDAADSLATFLLIDFFEDGQEIALSAADLFNLESDDDFSEDNFWGEHSLDASRFYSTLCLVYGSDPETYAAIYEAHDFEEEWKNRCIFDYENTANNWLKTLEPIVKKPL